MGWILFLEETKSGTPTPHAWPDSTTRLTVNPTGFRLNCGDATMLVEEVEHTLDFQQVMMWLNPEDEGAEPADGDGGEEP
jgi:hypothetical protein